MCPKGRSKFQVEIQTDDYPTEMYWQLVGSDGAILAGSDRTYVEARTKLHAPSEQEFYCLEIGSYTFKMLDSHGDGFCCSHGSGHMIGMLEGAQIFEGGQFEAEESIAFTVEELPEAVPTAFPTNSPTRTPTNSPTPQPTRSPTSPPTPQPTRSPTSPPTRTPADCAELQATYGVVLKKTTGNQCIWMSLDENGADCQICAEEESSCEDESGKHPIHLKSNGTKLRFKNCAWAGKAPNNRCKKKHEDMMRTVADICPETCKPATCQRPNVANAKVKCANEKTANTLPSYETTCTVTCANNYGILDHTNELVKSVDTVCLEDGVTRYHYDGQATENVFSQQCTPL